MASKTRKSKKRSAQSSPPPEVTLFVDRNAGKKLAAALRDAGYTVHHHDELFPPNELDENWLREVGAKGWIVITHDDRIRYRPLEKLAVEKFGVKMIVPAASANLRAEEVVAMLLKWLPKSLRFMARHEPPVILRVRRDGSLQKVSLE